MTKQSLIRMIFQAWIFTFFDYNLTRTPKKTLKKKLPKKLFKTKLQSFLVDT